jgi:hypothetical protein
MIDDDPAAALMSALGQFAARIAALDPPGSPAVVELTVGGTPVALTGSATRALIEAALAYHDPRDRGACDHCGSRRLDDNFLCADCRQPSGVFGQLIRERAAHYEGPPPALDT